ncbi:hypothetical protein [Algoriphagus vanfongensis]|uniref:hypothetical protein n=1 Tax=Algoriphagus vanfongensis TaxID=426371 RepID=UPI0004005A40|nr:hypothetical protein [Algoriphagus vanfongensis]
MSKISIFSFKKAGILSGVTLGLCLLAGESFAQSERDKLEPESSKTMDRVILEDQLEQEVVIPKVLPATNKSTQKPSPIPSTPIRREVVLNPEGKKVEPVPSTLSFNIFLYVVDKFKAD